METIKCPSARVPVGFHYGRPFVDPSWVVFTLLPGPYQVSGCSGAGVSRGTLVLVGEVQTDFSEGSGSEGIK